MLKFVVEIDVTERRVFHIDAQDANDAEARFMRDGEEVSTETVNLVVVSARPATP